MTIRPDDEAKTKRALKLVDEIDMARLMEVFSTIVDSYGDFAISVGNIEKKDPKVFEALEYLGQMTPELMSRIVETQPPEIVGLFMRILVRMSTLGPQMSKLMDQPAEEKIRLGEEMKEFAKDFRDLLRKMGENTGA